MKIWLFSKQNTSALLCVLEGLGMDVEVMEKDMFVQVILRI